MHFPTSYVVTEKVCEISKLNFEQLAKEKQDPGNMKRKIRLLIILILGLTACENELAEIEKFIPEDFVGKENFQEIEILYSDSAVVRVRIVAPAMVRHLDRREPRQEFTEGVKVDFFNQRKNISSTLTAKYAIRLEKDKEILVRDSVVLESIGNQRLETSELIWDERKEKIHTNKFVMITTPDEKIWGYGFEANQEFTQWKIKAIEGELKVEELGKEFK